MTSSRLSAFCAKIIEAGWLTAVIAAPLFFNVYSSRVFEPDKLTLVRTLATVMAAAWVIKWLEERNTPRPAGAPTIRTALVLPTTILVGVYLLTTFTSITPRISFFGSYQRLQGTYTTLAYIIVFLMIVQGLRTRRQLDRLIATIILTSLPIAMYGLLQRYKLDPLPWGGDVTQRVASNMGNPIFVAAYLIIAFYLTLGKITESFRSILIEEEASVADILRAAGYIFIAAVQAIVILVFAGSRGPFIGFFTGFFVFGLVFLVDLRRQAADQEAMAINDIASAVLAGIAWYAIPGIVAGATVLGFPPIVGKAEWIKTVGAIAALLCVLGVGVWLLANRQTWKWLWLTWITIAVIGGLFIVYINAFPDIPISAAIRRDPTFGRVANLIETEGGTGKVRILIWEGNTQLVPPHEPIRFPDGTPDPLNLIRPLVGYGPESMYVAYNRFYPPDLAHYESRNASPDRSHNETWDSLVITGVIGLLAYQFLFISFFIYGFQCVGMMPGRRERNIFIGLWVGLGLAGGLVTIVVRQPKYLGMGVPGGILAGIILYLVIFALFFYSREQQITLRPQDRFLIAALLAGVTAHYIEIHFGIAIASTRTLFWAFAGMLVVVGAGWVKEEELAPRPAPQPIRAAPPANVPRHKKRRQIARLPERPASKAPATPPWVGTVAACAFVVAVILSTLFYEFVTNAERLSDPGSIIWRALTYIALQHRPSYAILGMFMLVWVMATVVVIAELARSGLFKRPDDLLAGAALFASLSMGMALIFAFGLAAQLGGLVQVGVRQIEDVVTVSDKVAGIFNYYYLGVFTLLVLTALALLAEVRESPGDLFENLWGPIAILPVLIATFWWVNYANLDPIRADIIYKQGDPYDKQGQWDISIMHYKHAIEIAPYEDFYYLWLGRAFLEKARVASAAPASLLNERTQLEGILKMDPRQTAVMSRMDLLYAARAVLIRAREINPLNTDHSANLARLYRSWGDMFTDPAQRNQYLEQSSQYYAQATSLSPHNAVLWNEWALVELSRGNMDAAQQKLAESLKLDDRFEQTYMLLGQIALNQQDWNKAAEAYQKALTIKPDLLQAQGELAYAYAQQGKISEAIQANLNLIKLSPNDPSVWNTHKNLAILYAQSGNLQSALHEAQMAASLAPTSPTDYRAQLNEYANQLRLQLTAQALPPVTTTTPVTR